MYFTKSDNYNEVTRAKMLFTLYIVEHILSMACSDYAGAMFRVLFSGSEFTNKYACTSTKTSAIVNLIGRNMAEKIAAVLQNGVAYSLTSSACGKSGWL